MSEKYVVWLLSCGVLGGGCNAVGVIIGSIVVAPKCKCGQSMRISDKLVDIEDGDLIQIDPPINIHHKDVNFSA